VLASFATESKSLAEVQAELAKLAANYEKMEPQVGRCLAQLAPSSILAPDPQTPHPPGLAIPPRASQDDTPEVAGASGDNPAHSSSEARPGPRVAYVDDAAGMKEQLMQLLPSLQSVIADVAHVMRRFGESLEPHHAKTGAGRNDGGRGLRLDGAARLRSG
jgi:hypothetical protein